MSPRSLVAAFVSRLFLLGRWARPFSAVFATSLLLSVCLLGTACGRSEFDGLEPEIAGDAGGDVPGEAGEAGEDAFPDTEPPPGCDVISAVVIEPAGQKVPVGSTAFFQARALCSDGSSFDVTASSEWTADNPMVASVITPGQVYALNSGSSRIRASYLGSIAEADLIVTGDKLVDLRIDPGAFELAVGGSAKATATAYYASGASVDVTFSAKWSSDNLKVATVSPGLVTGVGPGDAAIGATFGTIATFVRVVVTGRTLKAIEVAPTNPTLGLAVTIPLTATAIYTDGTRADVTASATWTSSNPGVASLGIAGGTTLVKGVSAGVAEVRATFGGLSGSTFVTVTAAKLTSLVVAPGSATIGIGASATLKATANYSDGTSVDVTASAVWTSSAPTVATAAAGLVKGVSAGSATVTVSFGGLTGSAAITVSPAKLLSIAVSPPSATAPLGSRVAFKATGTYEGGVVRDITNDVAWSTDAAIVASISNAVGTKGELTPVAVGATVVRAKLDGLEGLAKVSVVSASVTSITITPNPLSLVARTKANAKATAKYSDGTSIDVTTTCTWATANAAIATVSNAAGAQGQVAALAAGTTTLSCTQGGVTGSGTITVTAPTLETVSIAPIAPTCRVGDVIQFQATAISSAGTSTNVTMAATWSSSAPTVLQYTGNPGRFRCLTKGTATASATYNGQTGSSPVTVTDAVPVSITVDPAGITLAVGANQQYQATALMSDGTSRNVTLDPGTTWTSSAPAIAAIGTTGMGKGRATALAAGTTKITANYAGLSGSATLTVSAAKVVSVQISPPAPRVPTGVNFGFTATAIYSDGTSREVTGAATWVSSNAGVIAVSNAVGSKGNATTLAAGSSTVTATFDGVTGNAAVTVTTAKLLQVQLTPFNPKLPLGFGVRLTATAVWDDGTTLNVTGQATWTSSNGAIAAVSNAVGSKGRITTLAAGSATISAQYNGVIGSTVVTVTSATLTSIAIAPSPTGLIVGGSQQLTATGTFSDGTTLDVTDNVGWLSTDTSVADVSNATDTKGIVYGFKAGTTTVAATRGAVSGKVAVSVK